MATVEDQLLSKIIRTGKLKEVLDYGITLDDLLSTRNKTMLDQIIERHRISYGSVVGPELATQLFPMFVVCDDPFTSIEELCKETRKIRMSHELKVAGEKMVQLADIDPISASLVMQEVIQRHQTLNAGKNGHLSISRGMDLLMDRYVKAENGLLTGRWAWPWMALQDPTGGLQEDDFVVLYGRPKCVPLNEPVLSADGSFKSIRDLRKVVAFSRATQKLVPGRVSAHLDVVDKEVLELTTTTGYQVRVGNTHPVLRPDMTYTAAAELRVGDFVGVARSLPEFPVGKDALTVRQAEMLGIIIGDGNTTHNAIQYTSQDASLVARLNDLVSDFYCEVKARNRAMAYAVVRKEGQKHNELMHWLRGLGMWGKKSVDKTLPAELFRSGTEAVLAVLGGLLSTDGHISKNTVMWSTSSIVLARQIKHLLLRIGVVGCLRTVATTRHDAYSVHVFAAEQHALLLPLLPYVAVDYKAEGIRRLGTSTVHRKRHNDGIPWSKELEDAIHRARPPATNGNPRGAWPDMWEGFSSDKLFRRTGIISRHLLRQLAKSLKAPELLTWADADVRWERITSINSQGVQPCSDVTVDEHHNFVVGDFITHNSMKSFVLTYLIAEAYMQGKKVLVYTKEMTAENMLMRISAFMSELPYQDLRGGRLSPAHRQSYFSLKQYVDDQLVITNGANDLRILCGKDAPGGNDNIQWFGAMVEEFQPDAAFIDGLYLMSDGTGKKTQAMHEKVLNTSRAARQLQLASKVPLICTMQANRAAAKHNNAEFDEIAYSDAIGQDVTCAIRVINEKTGPTIALLLAGSREFRLHGLRIAGEPCLPFTQLCELTERDIDKARNNDSSAEEAEDMKNVAKKRTKASSPPTKDPIQEALKYNLER